MIKFLGERDGRTHLGIVITEGNIERLKLDQPIHFTCEQMNLPTFNVKEIVIIYAKTEKDFVEFLKETGHNPEIRIDPLDTKQ